MAASELRKDRRGREDSGGVWDMEGGAMKLLTFLGIGKYLPVRYVWDGHEYETDLFPEALTRWLHPSEVLVLLTAEAKQHPHWTKLQERLAAEILLTPVDIASGRSESELWNIFAQLTDHLNDGDTVVFDVTHAFRSLPILCLLAAAYLRVAKNVCLHAIVYGAEQAKDENNRAPVVDLTPFLGLLDWITATDKFVKSGDAHELADLLKVAHSLPWKSSSDRGDLPRQLQRLGTTLQHLSDALSLARPHEIAEHAAALARQLDLAAAETVQWAQPFTVLLERTRTAYAPLVANTLSSQRALVRWYSEQSQVLQAVTLAREWVVSWTCAALGRDLIAAREAVETALNQASRQQRGEAVTAPSSLLPELMALPNASLLRQTWDGVNDLRNDTAHCGQRAQPRPTSSIVQAARRLAEQLERLPLPQEDTP